MNKEACSTIIKAQYQRNLNILKHHLFKKATNRNLELGVQTIHSSEIEAFFRLVVKDCEEQFAAKLAILLQDVYEKTPFETNSRICTEIHKSSERIRNIDSY